MSRRAVTMAVSAQTIEQVRSATEKYKYGFVTDIDLEFAPKGLNEDIIRFISAKKQEPERSEEHTSELQSLMRISYAVFCLKKKKQTTCNNTILTINYT